MLKCFKKKSPATKNYCSKCGAKQRNSFLELDTTIEEERDGLFCGKHAHPHRNDSDSERSPSYKKSKTPTATDVTIRAGRSHREEKLACYGTDIPEMAYMPVSKDNPYYNMNHPRRGKAVIFNFDRWDNTTIPDLGLSPRLGSEKDKQDLSKTLRRLDFEVEQYDNCGNLEMWAILDRLKNEDHSDADCLLVGIMTHGERNTVYVKDGTQIPVNLIWENFEAHNCPTLAGKPKIFIVQACRGKKYDSGTVLTSNRSISADKFTDVTDSGAFSYVIPNAADIIVAFSCPLGHYSWRNPEQGSWFIQSICNVFNRFGYEMDLQSLLTTVAREVALNYQSNTTEWESNKKKQVTSTSSTLIRIVKFKPKRENPGNGHIAHLTQSVQSPQEQRQVIGVTNGNGMEIEVKDSTSPSVLEKLGTENELTLTNMVNICDGDIENFQPIHVGDPAEESVNTKM